MRNLPHRRLWYRAIFIGIFALILLRVAHIPLHRVACWSLLWTYHTPETGPDDFEGFNNETGVLGPYYIVPNIVHFIRFNQPIVTFVDFVCILSALKNQKPDRIMFHTNLRSFEGPYWKELNQMKEFVNVSELVPAQVPSHIFGQSFSPDYGAWHSADIARIQVLMEHGGIFLDNDVFVVRSLDELRRFEMSLGWSEREYLGTQILVAHKDARFLRLWLETYRGAYVSSLWYYNAGARPTKLALDARPELVHREKTRLGVSEDIKEYLYDRRWTEWKSKLLTAHLFTRHHKLNRTCKVAECTEKAIWNSHSTFTDMIMDVYPDFSKIAENS